MLIGVFGGVGSGKSLVLEILEKDYSAYVIQTDKIAHLLYERDREGYISLIKIAKEYNFLKKILDLNKNIDRKSLGEILYTNEEVLRRVNSVIHPLVWNYIKGLIKENEDKKLIVVESAILPTENELIFDCKIYVYTEINRRYKFLRENRNYSNELIKRIMDRQSSDEYYINNTDIILENNSDIVKLKANLADILKRYNIYY